MKALSNAEFNSLLRERTLTFALQALHYLDNNTEKIPRVIQYQLSKSATSVGANFRAFCRGRSPQERYAKICVTVEESDETTYWLSLIEQGAYDTSQALTHLLSEADEILRIVASIKRGFERKR